MKNFTLTLFIVFFTAVCQAKDIDLSGKWNGQIEIPGTQLKIHVKFHLHGKKWQGKIDIPQQGAKGLSLGEIKIQGKKVTFAIIGIPGNPTFKGEKNKNTLTGDFVQQGQKFKFHLKLDSKEAQAAKIKKQEKALKNINAYITEKMKLWSVPGLSLAIVTKGKVLVRACLKITSHFQIPLK